MPVQAGYYKPVGSKGVGKIKKDMTMIEYNKLKKAYLEATKEKRKKEFVNKKRSAKKFDDEEKYMRSRNFRKTKTGARKKNPWVAFSKKYRKDHPFKKGSNYKAYMQVMGSAYKDKIIG